jgi:hypothetical protein
MIPTREREFSAKDTAIILGCSRTYLYTLIRDGKLTPVKRPTILKKPPQFFSREEVLKLAAVIHGHELTDTDIDRLRKEAQANQGS